MKVLNDIIKTAAAAGSSDIHITTHRPASCRVHGMLYRLDNENLTNEDLINMFAPFFKIKGVAEKMENNGEADFAYAAKDEKTGEEIYRFRVNMFKQKGELACVMRLLPSKTPSPDELGLPVSVRELINLQRGLVLVTGQTGSGKSTTLASLINVINHTQQRHIITIEDPIEFVHFHNKSEVNQREVGIDTKSFASALRVALREDPDVVLVGEMRDLETIQTALTAAETGHLVFSTLHTNTASSTIDRIIDVFPADQQQQIKVQLANVLEAVICQQLLPTRSGKGRVAAFEVMLTNPAVKNLIREGFSNKLQSEIQVGRKQGMQTMDACLCKLYEEKKILAEDAVKYAFNVEEVKRKCLV